MDKKIINRILERVFNSLNAKYPEIEVETVPDFNNKNKYYTNIRFQIFAQNSSGEEYFKLTAALPTGHSNYLAIVKRD